MRGLDRRTLINIGLGSTAGLALVLSILIGYALGTWLDRLMHTKPIMMLIFTALGIAGGFLELARITRIISKDD